MDKHKSCCSAQVLESLASINDVAPSEWFGCKECRHAPSILPATTQRTAGVNSCHDGVQLATPACADTIARHNDSSAATIPCGLLLAKARPVTVTAAKLTSSAVQTPVVAATPLLTAMSEPNERPPELTWRWSVRTSANRSGLNSRQAPRLGRRDAVGEARRVAPTACGPEETTTVDHRIGPVAEAQTAG